MFRKDHYVHPGLALGYRYTDGAFAFEPGQVLASDWQVGVYEPSGQPGARAPHLWLDDARELSLIDLFEKSFVLLAASDLSGDWRAAVDVAQADTGTSVHLEVVGDRARPDPQGQGFAALYGVDDDGAVLVRPDGHVAWRARSAAEASRLSKAVMQGLAREGAVMPLRARIPA